MKLLLTGTSGFLGNILFNEWKDQHEVFSLGRKAGDSFQFDLTADIPDLPHFDLVVHAAGKAHSIPRNQKQAQEFFNVNVNGTINLLKALETNPPDTFILISSVAVYGMESGENIDETYPLNAIDPYGKSKIESEKAVLRWSEKKRINTVILRLPLIAGPNPPGNLGAMMRAIRAGYYFRIGKGNALRSVVNAIDVARFIPQLFSHRGIYNLASHHHPSVAEIDTIMARLLDKKVLAMPAALIKQLAFIGDLLPFSPVNSYKFRKLTTSLTFSDLLARRILGWKPENINETTFK